MAAGTVVTKVIRRGQLTALLMVSLVAAATRSGILPQNAEVEQLHLPPTIVVRSFEVRVVVQTVRTAVCHAVAVTANREPTKSISQASLLQPMTSPTVGSLTRYTSIRFKFQPQVRTYT